MLCGLPKPVISPCHCRGAPVQVMAAMGMEKGGPALGLLMDRVLDWQLCRPHGTAEECRQYLQANFSGTADMQR